MNTKICTKCKEEKPRDNISFPPHNKCKDGLDSWCRKCRANYRSEICRGKFRGQLTDDEVRKLKKQEKCDICGGNEIAGSRNNIHVGKLYALVMDHNHNSGKFRGMLCHHCNRGLGNFKDNINTLHAAIEYLRERDK
ncbi:endonuclease VII [Synechococcus phage S-SRM01]|uniref:Recombination endonuclease VII n=1 Tax=Synechococcus phage S-SRM01 TaxID=2781608 RepID=A0A879R1V9_9CAUD|nr:endonuclease VII [Synechococcus phage S-SRM01]QPX48172.1 recombination endonuclease VII [Synechococcus phage S-SRM01]